MKRNLIFKKDGTWYKEVYTKYITRGGKRIYPKNASVFRFIVPVDPPTDKD